MPDYAIYDGATGQPTSTLPAPGQRLAPAGAQITPAEQPYDLIGDELAPAEGEVPSNIVATPGPFSRTKA